MIIVRLYPDYTGSRPASRSHIECLAEGKSIPCDIPDDQIGRIVSAIVLPDAWTDRVLAQVHLVDEVERVQQERRDVEQRLRRLGTAYVDGLYSNEDYHREKRFLEDRISSLVIPGVDAAREAGKILEDLPLLWEQADLTERRKLLVNMLDAVYVDTLEERGHRGYPPEACFHVPPRCSHHQRRQPGDTCSRK